MLVEKDADKVQRYINETMEELSRKILEEEYSEDLDEALEPLLATINFLQSRVIVYRLEQLDKKIAPTDLEELRVYFDEQMKRQKGHAGNTT
jgi:hypothetical protein